MADLSIDPESRGHPSDAARDPSDLRRATILLASLPDEERAALLQQLTPDQLDRVATAAAQLDRILPQEQEAVFDALRTQCGGDEPCADAQALERATCVERLDAADPHTVTYVLQRELPQTIALLLAQIGLDQAAGVLAGLSSELQLEVVQRLAVLGAADPELATELLRAVTHSVWIRQRPTSSCDGGEMRVAQLVNRLGPATERALLINLSQEDRPLVDRVLQKMFLLRDLQRPILMPRLPASSARAA